MIRVRITTFNLIEIIKPFADYAAAKAYCYNKLNNVKQMDDINNGNDCIMFMSKYGSKK